LAPLFQSSQCLSAATLKKTKEKKEENDLNREKKDIYAEQIRRKRSSRVDDDATVIIALDQKM
jgi:hypothetical protein